MARPISRLLLLLTGLSPLSASAAYWQDASTIDWSAVRARTSMQSDPTTFRTRVAGSSEKSLLRLSPHERKDQYFHHIRVLDGEIDHRDQYFTDEEKAANDQFMPCCSRAKGKLLVLDL